MSQSSDNQPFVEGEASGLQQQIDTLRQLLNTVLILVVVVSGTLTIFLLRQYKGLHQEVENMRMQVGEAEARNEQMRPKMDDFEKRISEFARTHPDFAQILVKYAPKQNPAAAPAPAKR